MILVSSKKYKTLSHVVAAALLSIFTLMLSQPTQAQDAADLLVRVNRLENQLRTLSGQLEQAQFENRKLQDQLKRFQEDVEFRFQDVKGAKSGTGASKNQSAPPTQQPPIPQQQKRGDAFDPTPRNFATNMQNPNLNGIDAQSNNMRGSPSALVNPILDEEGFDEQSAFDMLNNQKTANKVRGEGTLPPQGLSAQQTPLSPYMPSNTATSDANQLYENAYAYLLQKEYSSAENGFRKFLTTYPRHNLNADATFWLGETFAQRNRHREAAEQFLKITTDFPQTAKAPDATLKLGVSLNALGAKDQACATFAKAERDFANRGDAFKKRVDQEQKRIKCA